MISSCIFLSKRAWNSPSWFVAIVANWAVTKQGPLHSRCSIGQRAQFVEHSRWGCYPHISFVGTHLAEEDASCLCIVVHGPLSRALGKGCKFVK